jgi:hypothetical protein
MKTSKAAGPTRVAAKMMKSGGDALAKWISDVCKLVIKEGKMPEYWR